MTTIPASDVTVGDTVVAYFLPGTSIRVDAHHEVARIIGGSPAARAFIAPDQSVLQLHPDTRVAVARAA